MPRSSLLKKLPEFMKSTEVLDLAFAEFPEPCVILNTNFEVLKINQAYLKFLNIPREEIPGHLLFDLFAAEASQDFQEKIKASLEKALHTGELQEVENLGFGVGQSVSYWKLKTVPIKEGGGVVHILQYLIDITEPTLQEQKSEEVIEENERFLNETQEIALIGSWELNLEKEELFWSSMVKKIHEVPADYTPNLKNAINFYKTENDKKSVSEAIEKSIKKGESFDLELEIITHTNKEKWVRATGSPEFKNGKCIRLYGATQDITARKITEQRLKRINDNIPGVVFRYKLHPDGSDELMYLSEGSEKLWGIPAEKVAKDNRLVWELYHPDDLVEHKESVLKSAREMNEWNHEWRINHPDGTVHWNRGFGTPQKTADGSVIWDSIILDVTKEKDELQAKQSVEKAYLESQQQFESLIRSIEGIFWEAKADSIEFTYVSPQTEHILGFSPEDWYADKNFWMNHIHPDDREFAVDFCTNQVKKGKNHSFDYRMIDAHGESVWLSDVVSVIKRPGEPTLLRGMMTDITNRKKTEKALEKNRQRLSKIMQESLDVICIIDGTGRFLEVSQAAESLWGYSPEELQGEHIIKYVIDEDKPRTQEVSSIIMNGHPVTNFQNRYRAKCGEEVPVIWSARWDKEEQLMYAIARDAREQKAAEKKLQLSEQRFKGLVQEGGDLIALLDENGQYLYASPTSIHVLGFHPDDFMEGTAWDFIHPDDLNQVLENFNRLETEKRIEIEVFRFKHKYGGWRWLETTVTNMLDDPAVNAIVANSRDITEKKRFRDLEHLEKVVLEMNFRKDYELEQILHFYLGKIEEFYEGLCLNLQKYENGEWHLWTDSEFSERLLPAIIQKPESGEKYRRVIENNEEVVFDRNTTELENLFSQLKIKEVKAFPVKSSSGKILAVFSAILTEDSLEETGLPGIIDRTLGMLQLIIEFKQKEEALVESNRRFTLVNRATRDAIYEWNIIKDEIEWGAGYSKLFGFEKNQSYSVEQWNSNIHPEDFEETNNSLQSHLEDPKKQKWNHQYRFKTAKGEYVLVVENGYILRDAKGKAYRMIGAMRDITDLYEYQKELAISNERYKYLTKATSDAIWDLDLQKNKLYWGEGFEKLFGYKLAKITTSLDTWTDNLHPEDYKFAADSLQDAIKGKTRTWEAEYRFKTAEGTYKNVFDRGYIVRDKDGRAIRAVGAMQDMTRQKEYEEQLKKYTRELEISNTELEQFAYVASHDLQEPLRMVTSFLTRLEEKYRDQLDDKAKRYIDFAVDGAKRMREIILDLLEFSRVGRSEDKLEQVDLNEIMDEVKSLYRKPIRESGAEIEYANLPTITAPKSPVRQVFQNLISNALKYRQPGIKPKIEVNYHETKEAYHFSVKDNGIGISSEYFEKIFIIFQRLHQREKYSGSGMGLAVTKKIVENLGGEIGVKSQEGEGSTFYFRLAKT